MSLRDQLVVQIKLLILEGQLVKGARLPSVRALARRLDVNPNTVLASYRKLKTDGSITVKQGSGAVVRDAYPVPTELVESIEATLEATLRAAFRLGYSLSQIRKAVAGWLQSPPPDRVIAIDLYRETAEILAQEIRAAVEVPVSAGTLDDARAGSAGFAGALAVALPFYGDRLKALVPEVRLHTLRMPELPRGVLDVPARGLVLVLSHSAPILRHADALLHSVRGDGLLVECRLAADVGEWRGLAAIADVVFADVLAAPVARKIRHTGVVEFRLTSPEVLDEIRQALSFVVPRLTAAPGRPAESS